MRIAFLSTLFFMTGVFSTGVLSTGAFTGIFAAQPAQSESGISENTAADTVHIRNSSEKKNVEIVRIKNSNATGLLDTVTIQNSDEPVMQKEPGQNTVLMGEFPQTLSHNERVRHTGKIITGAALFGVSYGFALVIASVMSSDGSSADGRMATSFCIPVLGPLIAELVETPSSEIAAPTTLLCLGWSAAQGIGLTLLISGIVGSPAYRHESALPFSIEPLVMKNRAGLTLRMRFN